jgi:sugar O-acyltransferase (sialic acid O-acetyltransferase NeuD family)
VSKEPILIVGAGGHARACMDVIEQEGRFAIGGLVGAKDEVGSRILGYPVVGTDNDLSAILSDYPNALVCVGQIKTPAPRIRLFDLIGQSGCALPVIISPRAYVSPHATVGAGTIVMHGSIVNAGASVGKNCILNSKSLVEHDAVVSEHCHISTSATVNGGVHVGGGTFLGSHASVRQGLIIGKRCIIGMGQMVLSNCADGTILPKAAIPA